MYIIIILFACIHVHLLYYILDMYKIHVHVTSYDCLAGTSSFAFVEFYDAKDAARWMDRVMVSTMVYTFTC